MVGNQPRKSSELRLRIMSALVLAAIALLAVWAGGGVFLIFASAMALLVFLEWTSLTGLSAFESLRLRAFALMLAPLLVLALFGTGAAIIVLCVCAAATYVMTSAATKETAIWAAAAVFYCGLAAVALVGLRDDAQGIALILLLFAIVWGTDIGAYFVGRKLGGPKLAPKISPGKTQSGAIGGLMIAVVCAVAIAVTTGVLNPLLALLIAAFVSIISQLGDLFESYLKRRFNVKDSGTIIPGHGGMFDRVDGLMPAAIALFMLFNLL
jgi:phosphatidate cytidylyltransferase